MKSEISASWDSKPSPSVGLNFSARQLPQGRPRVFKIESIMRFLSFQGISYGPQCGPLASPRNVNSYSARAFVSVVIMES